MRRLAALIFGLAIAACASVQDSPPPDKAKVEPVPPAAKPPAAKPERIVQPEREPSAIEVLLAEFERLRRLAAPDLAREQEAARQAFAQTRSDAARVQLAMALTVPGAAAYEDARALELLDPLVKNSAAPLHGIAYLLAAHIQDQRRLAAQMQGLQQSNQGLQQNVNTLQQNVQALQQKLEALRTLERSLTERGETPPRKR